MGYSSRYSQRNSFGTQFEIQFEIAPPADPANEVTPDPDPDHLSASINLHNGNVFYNIHIYTIM